MKNALFERLYPNYSLETLCSINQYLIQNDVRNGTYPIYAIIRQARQDEAGLFRFAFFDKSNLEIGSIVFTENTTPEEGIAYIRGKMGLTHEILRDENFCV